MLHEGVIYRHIVLTVPEVLREQLDTDEIDKLVDYCYKRYPKGFVANVQTGDVPSRYKSLAKYLAKYVVMSLSWLKSSRSTEPNKAIWVIFHLRQNSAILSLGICYLSIMSGFIIS